MRVAVQAASLVDLAPPTIADVRVCARSVYGVKADVRLQLSGLPVLTPFGH